jgi:hypothetical protein
VDVLEVLGVDIGTKGERSRREGTGNSRHGGGTRGRRDEECVEGGEIEKRIED